MLKAMKRTSNSNLEATESNRLMRGAWNITVNTSWSFMPKGLT